MADDDGEVQPWLKAQVGAWTEEVRVWSDAFEAIDQNDASRRVRFLSSHATTARAMRVAVASFIHAALYDSPDVEAALRDFLRLVDPVISRYLDQLKQILAGLIEVRLAAARIEDRAGGRC